jgi:hypothetical protein
VISHLYNSVVKVLRPSTTNVDGMMRIDWVPVGAPLNAVPCRLDLTFLRPGKDAPMPTEAGKAPDHVGVMFCASTVAIKAGDRVQAIPNSKGVIPVPGVFEIRQIPDQAVAYSAQHHIEVQIVETSQQLTGQFPNPPVGP